MSSTTSISVQTEPKLNKRVEIALNILLAIVGPLLIIGLLEGVAYFWEKAQAQGPYAWEMVASRRLVWVPYREPGAGFTLMKPYSHYEWQGIPVEINMHGLRGPDTTFKKPNGEYRILNLGDSVAMGWGVRQEETYGMRLEKMLNTGAGGNQPYEVINAGVPGWNLENELSYLEAQGVLYEPDVLVLDVTLANDINGKSALLRQNGSALIQWLRAHTYFWPFLSIQMEWLQARAAGKDRISFIDPPIEAGKYFPTDPDNPKWERIWGEIEAIDNTAKNNGASFILTLFPLEYQVLDENYPTTAQDFLTAKAAEQNIPVVDLLPDFRRACQEKPGGTCQLEDRYLFADVWMHPSALGHQIAADELAKFVPEEVQAAK